MCVYLELVSWTLTLCIPLLLTTIVLASDGSRVVLEQGLTGTDVVAQSSTADTRLSGSNVRNIWFLSPHVLSNWENLALLSLFTFWGKCVYFIIDKLKNKRTFPKKYTNWARLSSLNLTEREETKTRYFAPKPRLLITWTKETTECFSGTLLNRVDRRARLRMAASQPETGLKWTFLVSVSSTSSGSENGSKSFIKTN